MDEEIIEIKKLSEFTQFLEKLPSSFILSRGQTEDFPLLPSALRLTGGKRKYPRKSIRIFLEQFKNNSYQYMNNPWDIKNDIEWMIYAQHYGVPTRLLDFTTSHVTSLLFAVETAFQESDKDGVVYFLNPTELNLKFMEQQNIINVSYTSELSSEGHDGPFVIEGRKINPRINAQKGLFVMFQDSDDPLEEIVNNSTLKKVIISAEAKQEILVSLYTLGISFTHIYPELTSVAKDIVMKQDIDDFLKDEIE